MRRICGLCVVAALMVVGCGADETSDGSPVAWEILLDEMGPGVHTVAMIVDFGPAPAGSDETSGAPRSDEVEMSGRLIWDDVDVALCGIDRRNEVGDGRLGVGDIFQSTEGCGDDPTAMQDAFDEYGVPSEGCVVATFDGRRYEYCAPLPAS